VEFDYSDYKALNSYALNKKPKNALKNSITSTANIKTIKNKSKFLQNVHAKNHSLDLLPGKWLKNCCLKKKKVRF